MDKYLRLDFYLHLWDKLVNNPQANNGFIPYSPTGTDEIHTEGKDEVLGNAKKVLRQDGNWIPFRPITERQRRNNSETMSCVSFSDANVLEEIILCLSKMVEMGIADDEQKGIVEVFRHFGILTDTDCNISDRYIAKTSGTSLRGNSQKNVANAIRKYGLVAESEWAWVDGWNNYYSTIPQSVIDKGIRLTEYIDINYEWADPDIGKDSLKYAPLQTSVYAWNGKSNDVYYYTGYQKNHATVRDAYLNNIWEVNDSYDPFAKKCTSNFSFGYDMIFTIHLKKKLTKFNETELKNLLDKGVEYILLVENYENYTRGLWKVCDNELVKIEASQVPEQPRNDAFIIRSAQQGTLLPFLPTNFEKLIT